PEVIARRARPRGRLKAFNVETRILIENTWSDRYTAIEASGLDRPGLLYDLTRSLSDLNLNIGSAHVATFGARAVAVFHVPDLVGHKLTSPARRANVSARLRAVFDGEDDQAEPRARRSVPA